MKRQSKQVSGTPAATQQNEAIAATASPAPVSPPAVRIVKISTCPSLSGKSTLTYHLGCTGKAEIQIRVAANSGGGFFSVEWIALTTIQNGVRQDTERPTNHLVPSPATLPWQVGEYAKLPDGGPETRRTGRANDRQASPLQMR